jgi:hypothetical protein
MALSGASATPTRTRLRGSLRSCECCSCPDESSDVRAAAAGFVGSQRADFQNPCAPSDDLVFGAESDVNDRVALWCADGMINFLGFSQG